MSAPLIAELPYCADSARLFEAIVDQPWAMFLDSGRPHGAQGRWDVLVAEPIATLVTSGAMTETRHHGISRLSPEDPFILLRDLLRELGKDRQGVAGVPFSGGALGYFAYDLGRRVERLPSLALDEDKLPEMAVGIYDWALVVDHEARASVLVGQGLDPRTRERWGELCARFASPGGFRRRAPFRVTSPVVSNLARAQYAAAFHRILDYIGAGDCYQVNLAQRFSCAAEGDAWLGYRRLRELNPAAFGAYLNLPWVRVLSVSPERFLRVADGAVETKPIKGTRPRAERWTMGNAPLVVETKPIKGTRPRAANPLEDWRLAWELVQSPKDRAENVMIVDLLRNDLGKVCTTGSVRVAALCALESFPTVHHLVSTVTGRLASGCHALDLLRACFPGGSITGAPKLRAMEIIEELEPHRRGIYCGSIGYIGLDGAMDSNIAIRTMIHAHGHLRFWAGGGLVADSQLDAEYQETYDKAAAMLELLRRAGVRHVGG